MLSIILFIIIIAVLILVHEFGHFSVAKLFGIRVDEFGLGFPPNIFKKKIGETMYTLNVIPFGGFVKIFGEDSHNVPIKESDKKISFNYRPKYVQALVLSAGVIMNIIFAYVLFSVGFMIGLPASVDNAHFGVPSDRHLIITSVLSDSPAWKAGLKPGDIILFAESGRNGVQNVSPEKITDLINKSQSEEVRILYKRGDSSVQVAHVVPSTTLIPGRKAIGISMDTVGILKLPIHKAFLEGAITTWQLLKGTVYGLAHLLAGAFTFKINLSEVSGPVGIASVVKDASSLGFVYVLSLVGLISLNLAVINLVPFPALDGGRLLFVAIEAVIKRKIHPRVVNWANGLGFAFLLVLMVVVTTHDIFKLF
jgi:regulator of sigma E protease